MSLEENLDELYENNSSAHGITHIRNVIKNCKIIGKKENADMKILLPAAMLHDIALKKGNLEKTNDIHAELGAQIAKKILKEFNYERINEICQVIREHSIDDHVK